MAYILCHLKIFLSRQNENAASSPRKGNAATGVNHPYLPGKHVMLA